MTEAEVRNFAIQFFDAIRYLHSMNVVHRDIKLENVLVRTVGRAQNQTLHVRLADFGFATILKPNGKLDASMGTKYYLAPEILDKKKYDYKVDVWSATIVLFVMLCGKHPVKAKTIQDMQKQLKKFDLDKELARHSNLSP